MTIRSSLISCCMSYNCIESCFYLIFAQYESYRPFKER
jgi:hypothetical protein